MLLSLFAAGVGSRALFCLNLSERLTVQLRASYIARGALPYAASAILLDPTPAMDGLNEPWADQPSFDRYPLAGGTFSLLAPEPEQPGEGAAVRHGFSDEERRINLNAASADVLQHLVEQVGGVTAREAEEVAASIEDWRDSDDDERPLGAEGFYYRSLRHGYDCKDQPFENIEELLLVRGISAQLYQRLQPYVTVYGSGAVNLNTAGRVVLGALGLSETGVAGVRYFRSGEDGREGTSDDRRLSSIESLRSDLASYVPEEDLVRLAKLAKDQQLAVFSEAFRGTIEALSDDDPSSRVRIACVLDRRGYVQWWDER